MNWKSALILSAVVGVGAYGFVYFRRQSTLLADACFKPDGFKVNNFSQGKGANITLYLKIKNKSSIPLVLTKQKYDISVEGKKVMSIMSKSDVKIPANGYGRVPLDIAFKLSEVFATGFQNLDKLLINPNSLKIQIKGKLYASSGILMRIPIPIDITSTLAEMKPDPNAPKEEC